MNVDWSIILMTKGRSEQLIRLRITKWSKVTLSTGEGVHLLSLARRVMLSGFSPQGHHFLPRQSNFLRSDCHNHQQEANDICCRWHRKADMVWGKYSRSPGWPLWGFMPASKRGEQAANFRADMNSMRLICISVEIERYLGQGTAWKSRNYS